MFAHIHICICVCDYVDVDADVYVYMYICNGRSGESSCEDAVAKNWPGTSPRRR